MISIKITQTFLLTTLCGLAVNAKKDDLFSRLFSRDAVSGEEKIKYMTHMVKNKEEGIRVKEMKEEITNLEKMKTLNFMEKMKKLLRGPTSKKSYYLLKDGVECQVNVKDFTGLYIFKNTRERKTKGQTGANIYNKIYYRTKNTTKKYEEALVHFRDAKHLRQIQKRELIPSFVAVKGNDACPETWSVGIKAPKIEKGTIVYEGDFEAIEINNVKYYYFQKYFAKAYYKQEDFTTELDEDSEESDSESACASLNSEDRLRLKNKMKLIGQPLHIFNMQKELKKASEPSQSTETKKYGDITPQKGDRVKIINGKHAGKIRTVYYYKKPTLYVRKSPKYGGFKVSVNDVELVL